jgi:hypothetical protein
MTAPPQNAKRRPTGKAGRRGIPTHSTLINETDTRYGSLAG